jgi:hypothetical protein
MIDKRKQLKKAIWSAYKPRIEKVIEEYDSSGIANIFPPSKDYKSSELFRAFQNRDNYEFIEKAKRFLIKNVFEFAPLDERLFSETNYEFMFEGLFGDELLVTALNRSIAYYLLKTAFVICYYHLVRAKEKTFLDSFKQLKDDKREGVYFRGQTNTEWRITPSILRNLNKSIVLDDNYYFKLLTKNRLEWKYNTLIRNTRRSMKYEKYAFMQHACSFSPFVDFTSKKEIAISFALSNASNFNDFNNNNSSVFDVTVSDVFKISDISDANEFLRKYFELRVINSSYFVMGRDYRLSKSDETDVTINITSLTELFRQLTPKFRLFDLPMNDRMKYQKGSFLCFYDCICLKNFICYELNNDIDLDKSEISTLKKRTILEEVYKDRKFDPEHLMNPYLFFNE